MSIAERLTELGITLPTPAVAAANYVPAVLSNGTLYVSGQLPLREGQITSHGVVGDDVSKEEAYAAARLCAVNILAQVRSALGGDLERVAQLVRLGGYVASTAQFTKQHEVINGASDLMVEVLQTAGHHCRFAVGVASLPLGASVEVDAIFAIKPS